MTMIINNFNPADEVRILNLYAGSGFDASNAAGGTTSNNVELDDISSAYIGLKTYLQINLSLYKHIQRSSGSPLLKIKVELKELGGAYSTIFEENVLVVNSPDDVYIRDALNIIHTLTAGQKANGVKIKITGTATSAGAGQTSELENIQTFVYGLK